MARHHGLPVLAPRTLKECNNTVVRLDPLPLVAKVADVARRPSAPAALRTELEVARHLARLGVPVAAPSPELPMAVHRLGDHAITFWRYYPHDPGALLDDGTAARLLKEVHGALASYRGPLPVFSDRQPRRAGAVLAHAGALPALRPSDRAFLAARYAALSAELATRRLTLRALHGDPHRGNLLACRRGWLMIDFESVCVGPLEWDLSALPGAGGGVFPVDAELLALLGQLRSVCVALWCWARPRREPEIDQAARSHLALLRRHAFGEAVAVA